MWIQGINNLHYKEAQKCYGEAIKILAQMFYEADEIDRENIVNIGDSIKQMQRHYEQWCSEEVEKVTPHPVNVVKLTEPYLGDEQ